jgi:ABC-type dipeptide/oligopeptide/nickel transport system permease subunit
LKTDRNLRKAFEKANWQIYVALTIASLSLLSILYCNLILGIVAGRASGVVGGDRLTYWVYLGFSKLPLLYFLFLFCEIGYRGSGDRRSVVGAWSTHNIVRLLPIISQVHLCGSRW